MQARQLEHVPMSEVPAATDVDPLLPPHAPSVMLLAAVCAAPTHEDVQTRHGTARRLHVRVVAPAALMPGPSAPLLPQSTWAVQTPPTMNPSVSIRSQKQHTRRLTRTHGRQAHRLRGGRALSSPSGVPVASSGGTVCAVLLLRW